MVYIEPEETRGAGAEAAIADMSDGSRYEIGRKTCLFVKKCRRDPALWAKIQARAAEIRAQEQNSNYIRG